MKVRFINKSPDWKSISIFHPRQYLEVGEIYDAGYAKVEFKLYPNESSFDINGFYYPESWFQIIQE